MGSRFWHRRSSSLKCWSPILNRVRSMQRIATYAHLVYHIVAIIRCFHQWRQDQGPPFEENAVACAKKSFGTILFICLVDEIRHSGCKRLLIGREANEFGYLDWRAREKSPTFNLGHTRIRAGRHDRHRQVTSPQTCRGLHQATVSLDHPGGASWQCAREGWKS